jgi:hypothetical protein
MRIGALAGYESSVGHNVLFTVITKTDGTFVSTTQQPLATNYPFGVVAADLNGDGNPDLVAVGNRCEDLVVTTSRIVGACFAGDRLDCGTVRTWRATQRSQEMAALHARPADSLRRGDAFSSARLRWSQPA